MNGHQIGQSADGVIFCARCGAHGLSELGAWCSIRMIGREVTISDSWWSRHRESVGVATVVRPCGPDMVYCDTGHHAGLLTVVRLS